MAIPILAPAKTGPATATCVARVSEMKRGRGRKESERVSFETAASFLALSSRVERERKRLLLLVVLL